MKSYEVKYSSNVQGPGYLWNNVNERILFYLLVENSERKLRTKTHISDHLDNSVKKRCSKTRNLHLSHVRRVMSLLLS